MELEVCLRVWVRGLDILHRVCVSFLLRMSWCNKRGSDVFSLGATMYEICLCRSLPANGQEWQDIRHGMLLPMPNTAFDLQMIIREMMAPEKESRPSAMKLLKKRQLLSDEQRQLIVERNKATAANRACTVVEASNVTGAHSTATIPIQVIAEEISQEQHSELRRRRRLIHSFLVNCTIHSTTQQKAKKSSTT